MGRRQVTLDEAGETETIAFCTTCKRNLPAHQMVLADFYAVKLSSTCLSCSRKRGKERRLRLKYEADAYWKGHTLPNDPVLIEARERAHREAWAEQ